MTTATAPAQALKLYTVILERFDTERSKRIKVMARNADEAMFYGATKANNGRMDFSGWQAQGVDEE